MRAATCCHRPRTCTRSNGYPSLLIPCYLLPTSQPLSYLYFLQQFCTSLYFLGGYHINSYYYSFIFLFSFKQTFYLFFRACFLFASFINVAPVVQSSSRSCQSIYKFFNSYLLSCFVILCTLLSLILVPVSSLLPLLHRSLLPSSLFFFPLAVEISSPHLFPIFFFLNQ